MSKLFKQQAAYLATENKRYSDAMVKVPFDHVRAPTGVVEAWRSRRFLAQIYEKKNGVQRVSICRTMIDVTNGRWVDGITWDELQDIKRQIGFGDKDSVEVHPADKDVVNVANMRHLWVLDEPLPYAWRPDNKDS